MEGSSREPRWHASMGTVRQKGCFSAVDKVGLACTGREAYAGGGFHRGAANTHAEAAARLESAGGLTA